jgi:hypothetical protein
MKSIAEAKETLHRVSERVVKINPPPHDAFTSGFMSVNDAAAVARMNPKTIHRLIREGKIRAFGRRHATRVLLADVLQERGR